MGDNNDENKDQPRRSGPKAMMMRARAPDNNQQRFLDDMVGSDRQLMRAEGRTRLDAKHMTARNKQKQRPSWLSSNAKKDSLNAFLNTQMFK
jgi:hypothetical protein